MKKFKFKFDAVLQVRKIREDESLRTLAAAQRVYQEQLHEKSRLLSQLENAMDSRENLATEPTSIVAYQTLQLFIGGTKQRISHTDQSIVRASRGVERALRGYLGAKRQTRAMELLYEKSFSDYREHLNKSEQREMDDMVIMRARMQMEETE